MFRPYNIGRSGNKGHYRAEWRFDAVVPEHEYLQQKTEEKPYSGILIESQKISLKFKISFLYLINNKTDECSVNVLNDETQNDTLSVVD